jgi:hypothetical protein
VTNLASAGLFGEVDRIDGVSAMLGQAGPLLRDGSFHQSRGWTRTSCEEIEGEVAKRRTSARRDRLAPTWLTRAAVPPLLPICFVTRPWLTSAGQHHRHRVRPSVRAVRRAAQEPAADRSTAPDPAM